MQCEMKDTQKSENVCRKVQTLSFVLIFFTPKKKGKTFQAAICRNREYT